MMKNIIKFFFLFLLALIFDIEVVFGQEWTKYINNNDPYKTIIKNIDQHFEKTGKGRGSGFKQYMRWRYKLDGAMNSSEPLKNINAIEISEYEAFKRSLSKSNRATSGDWESMGPYTTQGNSGLGRINCMAHHPSDPNIMWVGTPNGGLWKTTNGGSSWEIISNYFVSLGISGIAIDYTNPDIIYILTGDGDGGDSASIGVLKTIDGGINWQKTGLSFGVTYLKWCFFIKIHPTNPQILLVGAIDGLYTNSNGGVGSWGHVLGDNLVFDLEFKPDNPNIYYLATDVGIKKFNNGIEVSTFVSSSSFARIALAVTPAAPNNVYAIFGGYLNLSGIFSGVYLSTNSGDSYTIQSNTPNILGWDNGEDAQTQAMYDLCLAVHESDPNRVYVGGINCWTSSNAGVNWNKISYWNGSPYVHADFHNLYHLNGTLFACTDGGIYKTTNNGGAWNDLSNGINIMQFYDIDFYSNTWLGGAQDNGTHSAIYGSQTSSELSVGDGFGCTWHSGDHSIQFLSSQDGIIRRQLGTNLTINSDLNGFWFTELTMSTNTYHLFANSTNSLLRGNQNVAVWDWSWPSTGNESIMSNDIRGYEQGTNDPNVMYVVSSEQIIKTNNILSTPATWTLLTHPSPGPTPEETVKLQNVTVDPLNANRVWVVCSGFYNGQKIFKSEDGGTTWTNISGSLPNVQFRAIVYDTPGSDRIYIGSDIGVFYKTSTMSDWIYFSNNLPPANVTSLKIYDGYIYAGTFGRGIWRSPLFSTCPINVSLTPANDPGTVYLHGKQVHYASNSVTSSRVISGSLGNEAIYTAGNYLDFVEGFWGKTDAFIEAKIGTCPE